MAAGTSCWAGGGLALQAGGLEARTRHSGARPQHWADVEAAAQDEPSKGWPAGTASRPLPNSATRHKTRARATPATALAQVPKHRPTWRGTLVEEKQRYCQKTEAAQYLNVGHHGVVVAGIPIAGTNKKNKCPACLHVGHHGVVVPGILGISVPPMRRRPAPAGGPRSSTSSSSVAVALAGPRRGALLLLRRWGGRKAAPGAHGLVVGPGGEHAGVVGRGVRQQEGVRHAGGRGRAGHHPLQAEQNREAAGRREMVWCVVRGRQGYSRGCRQLGGLPCCRGRSCCRNRDKGSKRVPHTLSHTHFQLRQRAPTL